MGIRLAVSSLMTDLRPDASLRQAGQEMRRIAEELAQGSPIGYAIKGYAGQGGRTATPWIGVFDPRISDRRPSVGLYVAYICHPTSEAVTLTLQQGSDSLRERVGATAAKSLLRQRADWVRSALNLRPDPLDPRSFGPGKRQPLYEAGSIGSVTYRYGELPPEDELRAHLQSMLLVLDDAVSALQRAQGTEWSAVDTSTVDDLLKVRPEPVFIPKSSESYQVDLPSSSQLKTRLHEQVVNDLAAQASIHGWQVASDHPMDLVLRRRFNGAETVHIVEVKQVRDHDATEAVRAAIGQLFTYRWLLFPKESRSAVRLVAAFSEDVGPDLCRLLSHELDISVLWLDEQRWRGCPKANRERLIPHSSPQAGRGSYGSVGRCEKI